MSLYYYEPFYTFDRLLGEPWTSDSNEKSSNSVQRLAEGKLGEGAIRALKPR